MFTGLVEETGRIREVTPRGPGARVAIDAAVVVDGVAVGDSIAVDGACLTVVEFDAAGFAVEAVAETLRRTSLGSRAAGDRVNLERAVPANARLGGHIVQGHIDGVGRVRDVVPEGDGCLLTVAAPPEILRYVVEKGSVAVDGVSLTVAGRGDDAFTIALIPHTMDATTLGEAAPGRAVNLEVDLVAKYVEAFTRPYIHTEDRP
ncbi:MAG: riboflavin synthase [Thermoleophilia bacterium]|nr:riboflavin synthase [Thermoleophilia bacterium]